MLKDYQYHLVSYEDDLDCKNLYYITIVDDDFTSNVKARNYSNYYAAINVVIEVYDSKNLDVAKNLFLLFYDEHIPPEVLKRPNVLEYCPKLKDYLEKVEKYLLFI